MIPIFRSHHSILQSCLTVDEIPKPEDLKESAPLSIFAIAKNHNLKETYILDTSFSGFIEAYKTSKKHGLSLRYGIQFYCCADLKVKDEAATKTEHKIAIWGSTIEGINALKKIYSVAQTEGFYYHGRIDFEHIKKLWHPDLILTVPFYDSFLFQNLFYFDKNIVPNWGDIKPIFFVEDHNLPFDNLLKNAVIQYAQSKDFEVQSSHQVCYYKKEDFFNYMVLRCIGERTSLDKPEINFLCSDEFGFDSFIPDSNDSSFVTRFKEYEMPHLGYVRIPTFICPEPEISNAQFLRNLCFKGFEEKITKGKIPKEKAQEYTDRCKYELEVIEELGFVEYVLVIWDINEFAVKSDIPRGFGRGSVCGSLVFWLIGVTQIDPIPYGLYFQRFISKFRAKKKIVDGVTYLDGSLICDVDSDYCYYRKKEIFNYIKEKYQGRVAKSINLQTLKSKNLLKECAKVIERFEETDIKPISDLIPVEFGSPEPADKVYTDNPEFRAFCDKHPKIYNSVLKLSNLIKCKSKHASAVFISFDPIDEVTPLELGKKSEDDDSDDIDKEIVAGYDMYSCQELALKVDILGLKTTTVVFDACRQIGLDPFGLDLENLENFVPLQDLQHSFGIFQVESFAQGQCVKKLKCKNLWELSCALAVARPGASDYLDQLVEYFQDGTYHPIDPILDDVLKPTGGVCLFQEQVLKMLNNLGLDLEQCELVRRAIGKKDLDKIKECKEKIYKACEKSGHRKELADVCWKIVEDSAGYQFNLSHSVAYASLSSATLYLKFKHPKEFFLACLKMAKRETKYTDILGNIKKELAYFGVNLYPPHILKSEIDFTLENDGIRFGIGSIKGISEKNIKKLKNFRSPKSTKFDIFYAANECKIPLNVQASLILCGSMDDMITDTRSKIFLEACLWNLLSPKTEKPKILEIGKDYNYDLIKCIKALNSELKNDKGKPFIKDSRLETLRRDFKPYQELYLNNKKIEKFSQWYYEKKLLGFSYSYTLLDIFLPEAPDLISIHQAKTELDEAKVHIVGEVYDVRSWKSKQKKTPCFKMVLKDHTDEVDCLMFDTERHSNIELCKENNGRLPEEGDIVVCRGKKNKNAIFVNACGIQENKVFMKISELGKTSEKVEVSAEKL